MSDEVREGRRGRFWMDDHVLDRYAKLLGVHGLAVYTVLCRRAGKNSKSHPSVRRIAEDLGISERQAKRELKKLKDLKLIAIEARKDQQGRQAASVYTVLEPADRVPVSHAEPPLQSDSETPGGEGSDSHPSKEKEDTYNKEGVEANASRATPNVIGLEKHVTDRIYDAMRKADYRLPNEHFTYHLGRAKDILAKDNPTDEELEALPAAFVAHWEIYGKADAHSALMHLRRQKGRAERLNGQQNGERPHPHSPEAEAAREKPRLPNWYASFYPETDTALVEEWISNGLGHKEILTRLGGSEAGSAA
jgi:DNA-binding Lrp family transcriptional regulator